MIKKILVPTEGSDHARKAIQFACDIASKGDVHLFPAHATIDHYAFLHAAFKLIGLPVHLIAPKGIYDCLPIEHLPEHLFLIKNQVK